MLASKQIGGGRSFGPLGRFGLRPVRKTEIPTA